MTNNIYFNALCSNGLNIWAIDAKGVIYEIDEKKKSIRLVYWLDEIDDLDGLKFPIMCSIGEKILIAPAAGQKFWEYDSVLRTAKCLTEPCEEAFVNYFRRKNKVYFVGRECRNIAIYDSIKGELTIENAEIGIDSSLSPVETRGGCDLEDIEDGIIAFKYGHEAIYELGLDNETRMRSEINIKKPVAFAHKLDGEILVITTDGKFYLKKEDGLLEISMPDGVTDCVDAPFHYWTRIRDGLIFMPCAMNMVLYYKNGTVKKICDTVTGINAQGQMGIFPCCAYGSNSIVGFSNYDSVFLKINPENKIVEGVTLKAINDKDGTKQFVTGSAEKGRLISEGDYGISLNAFLDAIVAE